jgi:hypothetical protein
MEVVQDTVTTKLRVPYNVDPIMFNIRPHNRATCNLRDCIIVIGEMQHWHPTVEVGH